MGNPDSNYSINFAKFREIIRNPFLTPLEKAILTDLLLYAGVDGEAYPSEIQLGRNHNRSDRHIRTILKSLKKNGLLTGWKQRGFSKSNKYLINSELYFRNDVPIEKPVSVHSRTALPVQSGSPLPPKVSQESNQLSSSQILLQFENTSNTKCSPTDIRRLHELCEKHSMSSVEDAIKEASTRNYKIIKVGLIGKILEDGERNGKPTPKPVFTTCGKCDDGFFIEEDSGRSCSCRETYLKGLEGWMKGARA